MTPADDALAAELAFLREEEKLARDVYGAMFDLWGVGVFENIGRSEQHHMDTVKGLLDAYGVADPVVDDARGAFTDATLAALYDELVARGTVSEVEALRVGAFIEELDLADLAEVREATPEEDVRAALDALACASRNHLRAFDGQLAQREASWTPEVLTEAEVQAVLEGAHESCGG